MNKQKEIISGIIGTGFAAAFHFEALKKLSCTRPLIKAVHSRSAERMHQFSSTHGVKTCPDKEKLFLECDIVHICTPPSTHELLVIEALANDCHVIVEKPFTGYFGEDLDGFHGDTFPKNAGLDKAIASIRRMLEAEKASKGQIMYAENWVYAPAVQKEREIIEKTSAQVLWMQGQQSHSGSHSEDYGIWSRSGGGSLMGKGCHPLSAAIYLKHVEGRKRFGTPIHPRSVSARTHAITRMENFRNDGYLKDRYLDVEDYGLIHLVFNDGTLLDVVASELVHGGVKNFLEVHASNHRTICNIAPNNAMQCYNPSEENFSDIYVVEKIGTKQGWSNLSPDEAWFNGYQQELEAFYDAALNNTPVESNSGLAADVISTLYAAYLSAERKGAEVLIPKYSN